jgi:hypothetical protein
MFGLIPLPYRILAGVAALALGAGLSFWQGYRMADRSAHIEAMAKDMARLQAEGAEWLRQATVAQQIAAAAAERQKQAEADRADMQEEIDDYAKAVASQPDCGCGFSPADVERLRHIGAAPRRDAPGTPRGPLILHPGSGPGATGR